MRPLFVFAIVLVLPLLSLGEVAKPTAKAPLSFKMKGIDGKDVDLAKFKGKVLLIVNVASECGLTSQYRAMQALHQKYAGKGLVVLGVPANEFGAQEPGTNAQIAAFCKKEYKVTFPMLAKVVVDGKGICPLYAFLTSKKDNPKFGGPVTWNFAKFVIGRDGTVVGRFDPNTEPDAREVIDLLETHLAKK